MLPANGPSSWDVRAGQQDPASLSYASVPVTRKVVDTLAKAAPRLGGAFTDRLPPKIIRFGVGDIIGVTIFEAMSGGLFLPAEAGVRPGNFINIPNQAVDANGNISIPYAGTIRARGRTQVELQRVIVDALKNRAIEPQVIVTLVDQRTSMINVITEGRAIRIPAMANPERLLDTISRAGGAFAGGGVGGSSGPDTWLMLERDGRREIAPFGALIYEPAVNNIYTHPNDTLYMYRDRRRSWPSEHSVRNSRSHFQSGGSRLLKRSPKPEASVTEPLIRPPHFSIAVKRGRLRNRLGSTLPRSKDPLSPLSTTSICATPPNGRNSCYRR